VTLKKLGRYELLRVLGKGAMGVVYEGRDPNLDRRVAIKTVKVENLSEEAAAEYEHRFRTEARSAARLQHPNIVSVYDSDRDTDVAFLVMEYIQGDDLKHHLDRGVRYTLEQSLKIIRDLLSALDYAHKQGIVHRDIKPANLLIEPGGRVKLTDFGVARIQDSGEATRTQGSMVGTLKYMAPEQVQGQKIDARADLFSVGVVLYQLLTDKRPFDGDNDFSIIHQIIGSEPPAPSMSNARLPPALDAVVARALAKDRDNRFATARDFAVALQAAIRRAEDQTVVPPANPFKRVEPALSRPLTTPGSRPGSPMPTRPGTVPGGMTSPSSVTQELELVYWKDVKDSAEPEELEGFLEKFPAGIYADLARRRLRKLAAGGESSVIGGLTQPGALAPLVPQAAAADPNPFPSTFGDYDATRVRGDASRGVQGDSLRPSDWVDQEYTRTAGGGEFTRTVAESRTAGEALQAAAAAAAVAPAAAAAKAGAAPVSPPAPAAAPSSRREQGASARATAPAPAGPKKKTPVAMFAGIGAVVLAGIVLAAVMGRGGKNDGEAAASAPVPAASAAAAPASAAPAAVAAAPVDAAAAASAPLPGARAAASQPRKATSQARAPKTPTVTAVVPEPTRPVPPPIVAKVEPEPPRPAPAPVASTSSAYREVEQCRDRLFLGKEICLAEHCDKAGARSHPLCVKRREEIRMREESKVRQ
jgi:serine/threonine protein kinase